MSFDMNKLMQQAAQMQEQVQKMQEEAANETAEASVGGGMVKVTANGAGQVLSIVISPDAIDPSDPEALGDLVLAGVNEALRAAGAKVEAKAQQMQSELLGGLGPRGAQASRIGTRSSTERWASSRNTASPKRAASSNVPSAAPSN